jgi:hypothetical protein
MNVALTYVHTALINKMFHVPPYIEVKTVEVWIVVASLVDLHSQRNDQESADSSTALHVG